MLLVLEVLVALSLLGLTFGIMFVVTLTGTSPPHISSTTSEQCMICEDAAHSTRINGYLVCETCRENVFPDL